MAFAKENVGKEWAAFRQALTSWSSFKSWLEVPSPSGGRDPRWTNEDLEPTPVSKRTWTWANYMSYWFGLSYGNWNLGSTFVGLGLNWWESLVVIFISQVISALAMCFNSRVATVYHIGYPTVARSVFGMWGSFYVVAARAMLAVVWYGLQLFQGASFLAVMLRCVFGSAYIDGIANTIPTSVGITSAGMLAFFLFWLLHLVFTPFRPYQLRTFFWFKSIIILPAVFGLFAFCMVETKGNIGGLYTGQFTSAKVWFIIQALNAGMGNSATLITNQPDIARWSKTRMAAMWTVVVVKPLAVTLSASLGILATAAINNSWGLNLWNPWDLLSAILDRYWTPASRALVFLSAVTWVVSILGTNIAANMIPFGADSTLLLPRYITIPRGQLLVQVLAFAICPWKILASASIFTTFLSGYGLFMASVVGIMLADYWLVTRGNVFVASLYDPSRRNAHYYYHRGWNVQSYIAYVAGVVPPFPGFVGTLGASVPTPAKNLGQMGWFLSFAISFAVYYGLCMVWPTSAQRAVNEMGLKREQMASEVIVIDVEEISGTEDPGSTMKITQEKKV
ncbi:allantoin [Xylariaceae sp. FL0804]|nr:allantoin [Xylariaceae sp. FL0804]